MASNSSSSNFDEIRWVVRIRRTLDEELEDDDGIPVAIFKVPRSLMASDPDSYTPQLVALGPYHCWRPELHEMERFKLSAAKRAKRFSPRDLQFHDLVEQLTRLEQKIRASYHSYLDFNGETLAWMMAIDASFLLEFLHICAVQLGKMKILRRVSSRMSHLVDYAGTKPAHNAVLGDIIMLENQIPLFVLRKMMEFQSESSEIADEILLSMLIGLFREVSPFSNLTEDVPEIQISDCAHLLDFLYQMTTPKSIESSEIIEIHEEIEQPPQISSSTKRFAHRLKHYLSKLIKSLIHFTKQAIQSQPVKTVARLPWTILSTIPAFAILKQPAEILFFRDEEIPKETESKNRNSNHNANRPPLIEEITIPSVSELSKAGVRFSPSAGGISTITFDAKTATLHLPTARLDVNTQVTLRNLVAYEASRGSGPLVFTRYTELMNGIVDSEEDVRLLREGGVILNHLKSDEEAAAMWNGMSKSIRLSRVLALDKVIEEVNEYYDGLWRVKMGRIVNEYVYSSWPLLALMAAAWLLFLIALQVFCSLFGCFRALHPKHS
ncbi:putative UPF0481 protein At3g02645 [Momordica charantia]|uniref:UPF0481 protein At3g02645 n=1 Tax=Momordica charantia TaxID=3673 RepID=A0A6J1DJ23_MOMCH|nr:putative UPF0481 protein At3g02645 [Momordica charantia]